MQAGAHAQQINRGAAIDTAIGEQMRRTSVQILLYAVRR